VTTYGKNAEGYRDPTATAAIANISREEKAARNRPMITWKAPAMKRVFICSRYRADARHTVEEALASASSACRKAIEKGCAPYAPHLYLPDCLCDDEPEEREMGLAVGRAFLAVCDEVWQWGKTVTEGMARELEYAKSLGIPIKVFNTIGIPYEQWNSVRFAGRMSPEELSDLEWAERTNDMAAYYSKWNDENSGFKEGETK